MIIIIKIYGVVAICLGLLTNISYASWEVCFPDTVKTVTPPPKQVWVPDSYQCPENKSRFADFSSGCTFVPAHNKLIPQPSYTVTVKGHCEERGNSGDR